MGLDYGFTVYKNGKVERVDSERAWVRGRSDVATAFGNFFTFSWGDGDTDTSASGPIFQKEYDGQVIDGYKRTYVKFEDFRNAIMEAVNNEKRFYADSRVHARNRLQQLESANAKLRELQFKCTEANAYAFDRWNDEIRDNEDSMDELREVLSDDNKAYEYFGGDYWTAQEVEDMLNFMKEKLDAGEVVLPFFSF